MTSNSVRGMVIVVYPFPMAGAPVSWQGLALPPTTFCADPSKVVS
jgi:hypothetical protein